MSYDQTAHEEMFRLLELQRMEQQRFLEQIHQMQLMQQRERENLQILQNTNIPM